MYTLKSIVRRGSALGGAVAMLVATIVPSASVFADALNPLTDRSLTLSSSSPGWSFTDGSGNSTYASPNSGANGQKTGETFSFKVSTDSTSGPDVHAFTFQYCTTSAGNCTAPGNGTGANQANLNVATSSPSEVSSTTWDIIKPGGTGRTANPAGGIYNGLPKMDSSEGNFVVLVGGAHSSGWTMATDNLEGGASSPTGEENYIILKNTTGIQPAAGTEVKVIFFGTDDNYITNPGAGAFFVKINDYDSTTDAHLVPGSTHIIDGGVTVANVMNQSIEIQTKVLETMDFSVGTVDPNTLDSTDTDGGAPGVQSELKTANGNDAHGICDRILTRINTSDPVNVLKMGDEDGEFSLETDTSYSTHSYWRLSSNSSAGATVYYSGVTLSNTVGDQIDAIGATKLAPLPGQEQFGLALDNGADANHYYVDYDVERDTTPSPLIYEWGADNTTNGVHASVATDVNSNPSYHTPQLYPLVPATNYSEGTGNVNSEYGSINTKFAFDANSNTIPVPLATENSSVVDCVTAKMRYVANIAATTPAGIYTTKVNYIAAPQY